MINLILLIVNFFILFKLSLQENITYSTLPCHYHESVNITNGIHFKNGSTLYNGYMYDTEHFGYTTEQLNYDSEVKSVKNHKRGCICMLSKSSPCVPFCCPENYVNSNGNCVQHEHNSHLRTDSSKDSKEINITDRYRRVHGVKCKRSHLSIEYGDKWKLLEVIF